MQSPQHRSAARRAQAEIIGLVLIVVLIAIGFLLYVKFALVPGGISARETFEKTNLGQSFLNSIIKADVACTSGTGSISFTLQDHLGYIASGNLRCPSAPGQSQDTVSKLAVVNFINDTLKKTLDRFGVNYRLVIVKSRNGMESPIADGFPNFTNENYPPKDRCSARKDHNTDTVSYPASISDYGTMVEIRLERC